MFLLFLALYSFIHIFELGYKIQQNPYLNFDENYVEFRD